MPLPTTPRPRRLSVVAKLSRLLALVLVLGGLSLQSGSAAEDPQYPGLPKIDLPGGWNGPRATGLNHVTAAKQWVRLPPLQIGAYAPTATEQIDNSCRRLAPFRQVTEYSAIAFFKSPSGDPHLWGNVGPFLARTVAFGSIPVEVSVGIRQPRDAEDLPVGLKIRQVVNEYCPGRSPYPDTDVGGATNSLVNQTTVEGEVNLNIAALRVDGVDLRLAPTCRTVAPSTISAGAPDFWSDNPENLEPGVEPSEQNFFTTPYFRFSLGGRLTGTVDIPAFTGCITPAGEDVSRLLTATVSGTGNPLTMRSEGIKSDTCLKQDCTPLPGLPFPATP